MPATPTRTHVIPPRPQAAKLAVKPDAPARQGRPGSPDRGGLPVREHQPVQNRVRVLLVHIPKLSIRGQARLAAEVGVSRSTVSRLVNGRINPSYRLARGVTDALERFLGRPLDMRDVFSTDGTYLTPSGCALCRCGGCLPEEAYDREANLRPQWRDQRPGDWSFSPPAGNAPEAGTEPGVSPGAPRTAGAGKEAK